MCNARGETQLWMEDDIQQPPGQAQAQPRSCGPKTTFSSKRIKQDRPGENRARPTRKGQRQRNNNADKEPAKRETTTVELKQHMTQGAKSSMNGSDNASNQPR